ncbi:hypothetical protein D3C72_793950 [compost metagenome]
MNATIRQHPRLLGQFAVALKNQVRQGAPAEIARADALPAITAGQRDAIGAIAKHVRFEVPGHPEVAAPGVGDLHIFQLREQFAEQITAQLDFITSQIKVMAQLASELVTATGAEDQPIVGAALAISDLTAEFAERLTPAEANFVPSRGRQWLGGDNQALHR